LSTPPLAIGQVVDLPPQRQRQLLNHLLPAERTVGGVGDELPEPLGGDGLPGHGWLPSYACWSSHCCISR
jgi:hypothetical protein